MLVGENLKKAETAAAPEKIRISGGELILEPKHGSACIKKRGSEVDVTPVLEKMREAGVKPVSFTRNNGECFLAENPCSWPMAGCLWLSRDLRAME